MSLRVIGAGVGRTGTTSLKLALEHLLDGSCYHMYEVFQHPEHISMWHAAVRGPDPDWESLYRGYVATVDWPGAAFWRPLSEAYPGALVLLSVRDSAASWFHSLDATINQFLQRRPQPEAEAWHAMTLDLLRTRFSPIPFDEAAATDAYERHNAEVRAAVPRERLLEWQVVDGWGPLCEGLRVPIPDLPFPHVNTTDDYRAVLDRLPKRES
jgi:hypothetical protein